MWLRASGLNPCCAGYYSLTVQVEDMRYAEISLNPCCAGYYSLTLWGFGFLGYYRRLNPCCAGYYSLTRHAAHDERLIPVS